MSTRDPEATYQAAEAQLRAYYIDTTAKYRSAQGGADSEDREALDPKPEWAWTESEQEILSELRDKAADAALALLQARGWFRDVGTAP